MSQSYRSLRHVLRLIAVASVVFLAAATAIISSNHQVALAKSARYTNFDVSLELNADGSFHVVETQHVAFDGGTFSLGHRDIPTDRMTALKNVHISEVTDTGNVSYKEVDLTDLPKQAGTYTVMSTSGNTT